MPEMHSKKPGFTCYACVSFKKTNKKHKNLKKQEIHNISNKAS